MQLTPKLRRQMRLQSYGFVGLFFLLIGMLAYLSLRYDAHWDWTQEQSNTLSKASRALLDQLDKTIGFTVYATQDESIRQPLIKMINRYKHYYPKVEVEFVDPELEPVLVRNLGITLDGEMIIDYDGRSEHVTQHSEQAYTNALNRLARGEERFLVFVTGHGERDPLGQANHDLGQWGRQLSSKGVKLITQNLAERPTIAENTAALVIAGPQVDLLPGEIKAIQEYVTRGGSLLWLLDPGPLYGLQPLAEQLSLHLPDATIVDPTTQMFAIQDPRVALVTDYPHHPIHKGFSVMTLFPQARPIEIEESQQWEIKSILQSLPRSWGETGELSGNIQYDAATDFKGPLNIGVVLNKAAHEDAEENKDNEKQQRIVVLGDGDFISNSFLGNAGNLDLGVNIANWLAHDDKFIAVPTKIAADTQLNLSPVAQGVIAFGWLLVLPLLMAASGFGLWYTRRRQ